MCATMPKVVFSKYNLKSKLDSEANRRDHAGEGIENNFFIASDIKHQTISIVMVSLPP